MSELIPSAEDLECHLLPGLKPRRRQNMARLMQSLTELSRCNNFKKPFGTQYGITITNLQDYRNLAEAFLIDQIDFAFCVTGLAFASAFRTLSARRHRNSTKDGIMLTPRLPEKSQTSLCVKSCGHSVLDPAITR